MRRSSPRQFGDVLSDKRARVPFALIALLLLVSSGVFLTHAETRDEPTESLSVDRAMERTESATQTATRDAVTAASNTAVQDPLTKSAETEFGTVIQNGDGDSASTTASSFERYLRALIYLEAKAHLNDAGQTVDGVETTVLLPEIRDQESFGTAIRDVDLDFGTETAGLESGVVRAEISNVTTVATRDGTELARETGSVHVAVAHPVKQLHDRVELFQEELDASVTESGFTQRFNARLYALGWARGYAQYSGLPVTEVIANRHVIPSANDAVYQTQNDVFDTADPMLPNAIRRAWLCMAIQDADGLYGEYGDGKYAKQICDASEWIFGNKATGEPPDAPSTLDLLSNAPGLDAEETIGVNQSATLPFYWLTVGDGAHSIDRAIDRIFEIDVVPEKSFDVERRPTFDHEPPPPFDQGTSRHVETTNRKTGVDVSSIDSGASPDVYYEISGDLVLVVQETMKHSYTDENGTQTTETTETGTISASFDIRLVEGELSPNAKIESTEREPTEIEAGYRYDPGPGPVEQTDATVPDGITGDGFQNYDDAAKQILAEFTRKNRYSTTQSHFNPSTLQDESSTAASGHDNIFGSHTISSPFTRADKRTDSTPPAKATDRLDPDEDAVEGWLEREWRGATSRSELTLDSVGTVQIQLSPRARDALAATLSQDLRALQENVSNITVQFQRKDMLHDGSGKGPFETLRAEVKDQKEYYLERDEPYSNVGEKVVYETRYSYFELLERDLEELEAAHARAMDGLDVELEDTGLGDALTYLQQGVDATDYETAPVQSPSITGDVSFEVAGSPTYLVTENVSSEAVPPVDDSVDDYAPMVARNENHFKLPYNSVIDGILSRIGNKLRLSDPEAELSLQMAAEALRAGELAESASRAGTGEHANAEELSKMNAKLESAVESSVEAFAEDLAALLGYYLYEDYELPCTESADDCESEDIVEIKTTLDGGVDCDGTTCEYQIPAPQACQSLSCRIGDGSSQEEAAPVIEAAVRETVRRDDGDVARSAIAISDGEVTEPLVYELSRQLSAKYRPAYADRMDEAEWQAVIRSATRPAVSHTASATTVTVDDTDLVEELDAEVRRGLESVSNEMREERLEDHLGDGSFDLDDYDDWVDGIDTPNRVPAGLPLLALPNHWYATVNVWNVEVAGSYARFEVTATVDRPDSGGGTTYVREKKPVTREIAGVTRTLGQVEPIEFTGRSVVIVVVPPGKLGVGDRDDEDPECSPTWPVVGDLSGGEIDCSSPLAGETDGETEKVSREPPKVRTGE